MKYKISNEEKSLIKQFKSSKIPTVFKTDNTDFLLFLEEVDFTVCDILLKCKEITKDFYEWIVNDSNNGQCPCLNEFENSIYKSHEDKYTKEYCDNLLQIMRIFKMCFNKQHENY